MDKARLIDDRMGDEPTYYLQQPAGIFMRIDPKLLKCIGFLGVYEDAQRIKYGGTAFVVALGERNQGFYYLVTAKHVAEAMEGSHCALRLNNRDGKAVSFDITGQRWWQHPTEWATVDSVVCPFTPTSKGRVDVLAIPVNRDFATPRIIQERGIGIGDEVHIAGLFGHVTQTSKNLPVMRTGHIAMMPDEKIPFSGIGMIDAYVVEATSIPGLSGCPVFVRRTVSVPLVDGPETETGKRLYGAGSMYFIGSMIGHWQVPEGQGYDDAVNVGLSATVPAYKIMEVLQHPELMEMRKAVHAANEKEEAKTTHLDSGLEETEMQTTAKGLAIPVPTTEQFVADLKKASRKKD
jgi:hypothetical protein